MTTLALSDGSLFNQRYRVVRCIAAGGMGAVYEVVHIETERRRALKVMLPHLVQSEELRDRFRQEARVAAHIDSEFIVDVFDAGIDEATGMPFLVMELLRGEELGRLLKKAGRFSPPDTVTYLYQTALALDKTHRANIVHRDLKPENLFLTERESGPPRIKVLDFGVAKFVADNGTQASATRSVGTPLYMAPEQFRPGHKVSAATDLYALGMMAFTLLVGSIYWLEESRVGDNVFAFAAAVMHGPQESPAERARRRGVVLPAGFDAWFARATAVSPADRFSTASESVLALADALGVPRPGLEGAGAQAQGQGQTMLLPPDVQTGRGSMPSLPASGELQGIQTGRGAMPSRASYNELPVRMTVDGLARSATTTVPPNNKGKAIGIAAAGFTAGLMALGALGLFLLPRYSGTGAAAAQAAAAEPPAAPAESPHAAAAVVNPSVPTAIPPVVAETAPPANTASPAVAKPIETTAATTAPSWKAPAAPATISSASVTAKADDSTEVYEPATAPAEAKPPQVTPQRTAPPPQVTPPQVTPPQGNPSMYERD